MEVSLRFVRTVVIRQINKKIRRIDPFHDIYFRDFVFQRVHVAPCFAQGSGTHLWISLACTQLAVESLPTITGGLG